MANQSRCRTVRSTPAPSSAAPAPSVPEPPVRRWPHPVEGAAPAQDLDPALLQQLVPEDGQEDSAQS